MVQDEYTLLQIILRSLENQLKCPLEKELKKKKKCHVFLWFEIESQMMWGKYTGKWKV